MDSEKIMKNISDLAIYEKAALLDKQLDDFLRIFADLSIREKRYALN